MDDWTIRLFIFMGLISALLFIAAMKNRATTMNNAKADSYWGAIAVVDLILIIAIIGHMFFELVGL